jgi:hypothetical protein
MGAVHARSVSVTSLLCATSKMMLTGLASAGLVLATGLGDFEQLVQPCMRVGEPENAELNPRPERLRRARLVLHADACHERINRPGGCIVPHVRQFYSGIACCDGRKRTLLGEEFDKHRRKRRDIGGDGSVLQLEFDADRSKKRKPAQPLVRLEDTVLLRVRLLDPGAQASVLSRAQLNEVLTA